MCYLLQVFDTISGQIACWLLSVYCEEQSRSVVTEENWSASGMWVTIVTLNHFGFLCLLVLACAIVTRRSNCSLVCVCVFCRNGSCWWGGVPVSLKAPLQCHSWSTLTSSLDWWGCVDQSLRSLSEFNSFLRFIICLAWGTAAVLEPSGKSLVFQARFKFHCPLTSRRLFPVIIEIWFFSAECVSEAKTTSCL